MSAQKRRVVPVFPAEINDCGHPSILPETPGVFPMRRTDNFPSNSFPAQGIPLHSFPPLSHPLSMENSRHPRSPSFSDAVRERAQQLWLGRGTPAGEDLDIWLQAEREIRAGQRTASGPLIDADQLNDCLNTFGDTSRGRSATSFHLT